MEKKKKIEQYLSYGALVSRTNVAAELNAFLFEYNFIYLDVTFLDLSVLDVLPEVVADGSEGGMHFYAEITSESNGSFV